MSPAAAGSLTSYPGRDATTQFTRTIPSRITPTSVPLPATQQHANSLKAKSSSPRNQNSTLQHDS
eukprot:609683-Amphidinium_carterae.1